MEKWVLVRGQTSLHYIFWEISTEHKEDEDKYYTMFWHGSDSLGNMDIAPAQFPVFSMGEMQKDSVELHELTLDLQCINHNINFLSSIAI